LNALPNDITSAIASNDLLSIQPVTLAIEGARELYQQGTDDNESMPASGFTPAVVQSTQDALAKDLFTLVQDVRENKQRGDAARDELVKRIKALDPRAKIVTEVRITAPNLRDVDVYMVADIIFRGNGTSEIRIVEVKSGEARLSPSQAAVLAEALKTGDVYISNKKAAEDLGIRPNETFKAQKIKPEVVVEGGSHATIARQLMNEGVDIGGRRSRFRLGAPPN
jgi:hypothetical protein